MTKSRKFNVLLTCFMLVIAGFLFAACGAKDYSKILLSSSSEYLEMFVGEQKNVTLTINNPVENMNKTINYYASNGEICNVELISVNGYSSTFTVTGLKGGNTTLNFVTKEGAKRTSVEIMVRQYSESFRASDSLLYVSNSSAFAPSSVDFVFDETSTEREMSYYFYGKKDDDEALTLEDITINGSYINNFEKVEIYTYSGKDYLVFTDSQDKTYTMVEDQILLATLEKTEDGYDFSNGNFVQVVPGEKYAFVAIYKNENIEEILYCDRQFTILSDINKDITYNYGYKLIKMVEGEEVYVDYDKTENTRYLQENQNLVLVPNYKPLIAEGVYAGQKADYVTVYLSVTVSGDPDLLKLKVDSNENIINSTYLGYTVDEDKISYYFEVNGATGKEAQSEFNIKFYYDGFEKSEDENITTTLSIPVSVKIIPLKLLANNVELNDESTMEFEFYNQYGSEGTGWQQIYFSVIPEGANIENLEIDLTESDYLRLKYKNQINYKTKVVIDDLKSPVYIKGFDPQEGNLPEGTQELPIKLSFNVIAKDSIDAVLKYKILKGASTINFKTSDYQADGIYLDIHNPEQILFTDIVTNAEFKDLSFSLYSDSDVADFTTSTDVCEPDDEIDGGYYLKFAVKPKALGVGTYFVTLDNGLSIPLKINVIEALDELTIQTNDQSNIISMRDDAVPEETSLYLLNTVGDPDDFYLDVNVVAHNDTNSTAIKNVQLEIKESADPRIILTNAEDNNKKFSLSISDIGRAELKVTANGLEISEFRIQSVQIYHKINVIYMSYIENLTVYKLIDGKDDYSENPVRASYVDVYSNTSNDSLRTTHLDVRVSNENAFRFYDVKLNNSEEKLNYVDEFYSPEYIYWTSDQKIYLNGQEKSVISPKEGENRIYEIKDCGIFDANTYTFYANQNIQQKKDLVLYAHVRQHQRTYTFAVNIRILIYQEVESVTLQTPIKQIELSSLNPEFSFVAYAQNKSTNPEVVVYFEGGDITIGGTKYYVLTERDIASFESDGKYQFTLTVDPNFINIAADYTEMINGTLFVAAKDWFDNAGRLIASYPVLRIPISYANGTENNPYTLQTAQDFLLMKDNSAMLSAHYKIYDPIDLSSISNQLPLGEFKGTIVGVSDQALISGIKITQGDGLFTSIDSQASLKFLSFEGEFDIDLPEQNKNVGLIAGGNNGNLINIGVTLKKSNVLLASGNVGGVVGENTGTISQNFFELSLKISANETIEFTPKTTIFMKDFLTVKGATYVGGVAGFNSGIIEKIDSNQTYTGYLNYMAYSLIQEPKVDTYTSMIMGGLVGCSRGIIRGIPLPEDNVDYEIYGNANYKTDDDARAYAPGKGIVVGGELISYGIVAGVVGQVEGVGVIKGITARAFVRAHTINASILANINNLNQLANQTSFAVQAVDDGRTGEDASMLVIYVSSDARFDYDRAELLSSLVFNNRSTYVATNEKTFIFTCVNREEYKEKQDGEDLVIQYSSKDFYYGDAVVVTYDNNQNKIEKQVQFELSTENEMSISPRYNNKMEGIGIEGSVYYAYYFKAAETSGVDIVVAQSLFDKEIGFNILSSKSTLYPIYTNGEMIFTSKTPNIISIDQNGQITVKNTGLAHLTAISILNTTKSIDLYIYVVNYFDAQYEGSIIYPNESAYSVPFNNTQILLRGNNTASLFVIPNYEYTSGTQTINRYGRVVFDNYVFNLEKSYDLQAKCEIANPVVDPSDPKEYLIFEYIGNETIIKRGKDITDGDYSLKIQPVLVLSYDNYQYSSDVNSVLDSVVVNYKRGAVSINNANYEEASIFSSKTLLDEIIIHTTDIEETEPAYTIRAVDSDYKQASTDEDISSHLFTVKFNKNEAKSDAELDTQGIAKIVYNMTLSVNLKEYNENVYGDYVLTVISASNNTISKNILIHFEQTEVTSAIIDNYTSLQDINRLRFMTSTSDYAYPGLTGLLEVTVNPNDSDFDYILIENDDENYIAGHASANFGLVAKNKDAGNSLFSDQTITGSVTSNGIKIYLKDIVKVYSEADYYSYNGIIYLRYDVGSNNVLNGSKTKLVFSFVKGDYTFVAHKELTIKLQNYVSVTLEGKKGNYNETDAYVSYEVARGLSYKLNINSYGFQAENIRLISGNENIGSIEKIGDTYYLNITSRSIDYNNLGNVFKITAIAEQIEGEEVRFASSDTKISVFEYVLNYNGAEQSNLDIVDQMDGGLINLQVGGQITLGIDMISFIEFDETNNEIISKINTFFNSMATEGSWKAYTNLSTETGESTYYSAPDVENFNKDELRLVEVGLGKSGSNFYFRHNGLNVIPVRTNDPSDNFYYFVYEGRFRAYNGVYVFDDGEGDKIHFVTTRFRFNVYTSSSEESPIPVYDYNDFTSMQNNGYYILLNDIVLPSAYNDLWDSYMPLAGNFKSFDGNGHSITFVGDYDMGSASNMGLFSSLKSGSVIKNLNVYYKAAEGKDGKITFTTSTDLFKFAGLVAENYGSISNCHVYTDKSDYLTVNAPNSPADSASYMAGLAVNNVGFITNSSVSANFNTYFFVAGVVAQNTGKIAASSFKNGRIDHNSGFDQHAAGFVLNNSESGQIITSYVAGEQTSDDLRSKDTTSYIKSTTQTAGFAYRNTGLIRDCYTDIYLAGEGNSGSTSGFVYYNGKDVKNCFSMSELKNNNDSSAGFAMSNQDEGSTGKFENCYYYYSNTINSSVHDLNVDGISKLNDDGFSDLDKNFAGYSFSREISPNAVWFFANGNTDSKFVDFVPTSQVNIVYEEGEDRQVNTIYDSKPKTFANGRLELTSPNIETLSIRNFSYSDLDAETGDITYYYIDESSAPNRGSLHNPILLSSAENFENDLLERSTLGKVNTSSYRLINNIDYTEFDGISQTYKVTFAGLMEGNGMTISQISMATMDRLTNGGLFGQIGQSSTKVGVVKNLYLNPKQVSFSNTTNVGALAGTLKHGYIYDVKAQTTGTNVTVSGLSFVGGIVGRATGSYAIQDAYSNLNVTSILMPTTNGNYIENVSNETIFSYSGGIAGFVGKGEVYNVRVENITSVMGSHTGVVFGGVGKNAKVNFVRAQISNELQIKAYYYGGFVAGEISGEVNDIYVQGNGISEFKPFVVIPRVATAVGGVAGILSGGKISNIYMNQSFTIENNLQNNFISFVGGVVGYVYSQQNYKSEINQVVVDANITARSVLGGAVGGVNSFLTIDSAAVKSSLLKVEGKKAGPYLGGIVGGVAISDITGANVGNAELVINNSYCWADLELNTNTPGIPSTAKVGGLIGSANNRSVSLNYCYTTSRIVATVYDSRALNDFVDVTDIDNDKLSYNQYGNNSKIKETYYFGWTGGDDWPVNTARYYLTYKTKTATGSDGIKLVVNNYGTSATELQSQLPGSDPTQLSILNNLYAGDFKLKIDSTVETFKYDIAKDQFNVYGDGTFEDGTFEKDPNNFDIYRRNILYSSYVARTGITDEEVRGFFKSNTTGMTYTYTGKEKYKNEENLVTFVLIGDNTLRSSTGHEYNISGITKTDTEVSSVLSDDWKITLGTITRYEQIHKSELVQVLRYKDSEGMAYIQDLDADGYKLKNESSLESHKFDTKDDLIEYVKRLGLKEIWQLNKMGLTTLAFENEILDWTKRV